jgi:hypothetical protein
MTWQKKSIKLLFSFNMTLKTRLVNDKSTTLKCLISNLSNKSFSLQGGTNYFKAWMNMMRTNTKENYCRIIFVFPLNLEREMIVLRIANREWSLKWWLKNCPIWILYFIIIFFKLCFLVFASVVRNIWDHLRWGWRI